MRSVVATATYKPVLLVLIAVQAYMIVWMGITLHIHAQNGWLRDSVVSKEFQMIRAEHAEQRMLNAKHRQMVSGMAAITSTKGIEQFQLDQRVRVLEVKVLGLDFKPAGSGGVHP